MYLELFFERILSILINLPCFYFYSFVYRGTHVSQTFQFSGGMVVRRTTFQEFKKIFATVNWGELSTFPGSLCGINTPEDNGPIRANYIHASIYRCHGVNYLFTSYGLIRTNAFIRRYIKNIDYNAK